MLECIQKLLHPFAEVTSLISGDQYVTIANIIPRYSYLQIHLKTIIDGDGQLQPIVSVACTLLIELQNRFQVHD